MAVKKYLLVIEYKDAKVSVYVLNKKLQVIAFGENNINLSSLNPGWIEFDPLEAIYSLRSALVLVFQNPKVKPGAIEGISIINQRDSFVIWDRDTGQPLFPGLASRCLISNDYMKFIDKSSCGKEIQKITGLPITYTSPNIKLKWIQEKNPPVKLALKRGRAVFGTLDSWILYHLTGRTSFFTDLSNAHQTQFFSIEKKNWDNFLLNESELKKGNLAGVLKSQDQFGETRGFVPLIDGTPILVMCINDIAELIGNQCIGFASGSLFFGDFSHLMINTGGQFKGLTPNFSSFLYTKGQNLSFGIERYFLSLELMKGWLENMGAKIQDFYESDLKWDCVKELFVVPTINKRLFPGCTNDHFELNVFGLKASTKSKELITAVYASIAHLAKNKLLACENNLKLRLKELKVNGELASSNIFMQFLADILQIPIIRYRIKQPNIIGAAYILGIQCGYFNNYNELTKLSRIDKTFIPEMDPLTSYALHSPWEEYFGLFNKEMGTESSLT